MDDMTTLTTTMPCTRQMLKKLQKNIKRARMKMKPSKSKGKLSEQLLYIGEEPIPTVSEKPVKSLGRWYNANLREHRHVPATWQVKALVSSIWSSTPTDVASHHLWGPHLKGCKTGEAAQLICQELVGSSTVLQQHGTVWKRHSGASCVKSYRGIQVLQSKAEHDTHRIPWPMCSPNSSYTGSRREVDTKCSHTAGKGRPKALQHCWPCATGERGLWPWREQTNMAQGSSISAQRPGCWGGAPAGAGNKMRKGFLLSKTGTEDEMGGGWEKEGLLEGALEHGSISHQLHPTSNVRCSAIFQ